MNIACFMVSVLLVATSGCSEATHTPHRYTIEQFLDTTTYAGASFTHDEQGVLVSNDKSGIFNVYTIDRETAAQKQLTHSTNHAIFILGSLPDDERFLATSDEAGNELNHIYLYHPDGTSRDLTPYPGAVVDFHGWSYDKKSFFFTSNARDPKYMDLYEMDIATWTPTELFQNDQGYSIGPISRDKRFIALVKTHTENDSDLYLYDLSKKAFSLLSVYEKESTYHPTTFSVDSNTLYYLTDEQSDFRYLKSYDIASKADATLQTHSWDITDFRISHSGRYHVTLIDHDASTEITVWDQQEQKALTLPKLPDGDIQSVSIAKSEGAMLLYVDGDRTPTNIYWYNLTNGQLRKLTSSLSPAIDPEDLVDAEVIRYPSYDGTLIPALYYKPKYLKPQSPALLWIHGGPGGQSRKGYDYLIQYLVNQGYPILAVNNRGSSGYGKAFFKAADLKHGEADLDDCMWAKKYLIETGSFDPKRIGILGGSYGGYMVLAALAFRPEEMAVGVDIFGVSNWVRTLTSIPAWWESEREALYKKIGNPESDFAYLQSISPLFHADKITKPLLVIQGANDPRVLKVESDEIIEAVKEHGIPHEYVLFDDEGHGFAKKQNKETAATAIVHFLDTYL